MKFMKLGLKLDTFQTKDNNVRVVITENASDFTVNVGGVKFYVHKSPLLSHSYRLQKLYSNSDEIHISDIPGGASAFELCAKFCYGMTVTVNAHNVVSTRCAAGYLEMYQTIDTCNLISKIDTFLDTSIFRCWKDSITALKTTKSLLPWSKDLKLVSRCIGSISSKVSIDPSKVDWSYAYDRNKLPSENGLNGFRKQQLVPEDWWVEDLCELEIDLYKQVITTIKAKGRVLGRVIGEALRAYTDRRIPGFIKGTMNDGGNTMSTRALLETIVSLLPTDKGSVLFSFLIKIHTAASILDCGKTSKKVIIKQLGHQLEKASVSDLMLPAATGAGGAYDIDTVQSIVEEFLTQDSSGAPYFVANSSKTTVTKLIDGYLAEISKDLNLPLSKFIDIAEMVSGDSRPVHDDLYHAINMYLKLHQGITKTERKRISGLIDCRRLSAECRAHAIQNELLPTRVLVQVLLCQQNRSSAAASTCSSGSSQLTGTTTTEENCNMVSVVQDLKSMKVAGSSVESYRSTNSNCNIYSNQNRGERGNVKARGVFGPKDMLGKLWYGGENSNSDTTTRSGLANISEPEVLVDA